MQLSPVFLDPKSSVANEVRVRSGLRCMLTIVPAKFTDLSLV